jgi:hypothetical protein
MPDVTMPAYLGPGRERDTQPATSTVADEWADAPLLKPLADGKQSKLRKKTAETVRHDTEGKTFLPAKAVDGDDILVQVVDAWDQS